VGSQLAKSAGWGRLVYAIQRYVEWQSSGRSFLVAGHRGSGKTTMVESAVESVRRACLDRGAGRRPLFVRVHGPDLFSPAAAPPKTDPPAAPHAKGDLPAPAAAKTDQAAPHAKADPASGATSKTDAAAPANGDDTARPQPKADAAPEIDRDPLIENVLKQICISLYRAAANEFIVSYRERVHRRGGLADWQSREFHEMAAQFAHDVDDCLSLDELRDYWDRIGLLSKGVLFAQPEEDVDQGALEIIALSLAGQAYQVVSGKWEEERSEDTELAQSRRWTLANAVEVKNLFAPFIGLITGGAVFAKTGGLSGILVGLLSALAISFSFSFTGSRSRDRKVSRKNTFAKDRTLSSLGRALPQLVVQFRRCGLHPVFVVDELDKVDGLPVKMRLLISYLKDFASDRALFCFLTDRDYLEFIEHETAGNLYVPEYSYFRDRIPVFYQPEDLRAYLFSVFVAPPSPDYELLTYSLLHRARLHPLDLRRELGSLGDGTGNVRLTVAELREGSRPFELLLQLAVEWVLASPELQEGIRRDARFAQLAVDALYYPSRSWAGGDEELDTSDKKVLAYLAQRLHPAQNGDAARNQEPKGLSDRRQAILLLAVHRVVYHLEDPAGLVESVRGRRPADSGPSDTLLDLVPRGERRRMLKKLETDKWAWQFNAYGQAREEVDISAVTEGTREDRDFLMSISVKLKEWAPGVDLGWIAAETGLPMIAPQWSRVQLAIDRVGALEDNGYRYPEMADDKLAIEDYAARLKPRSAALSQTLCCAWALAAGSGRTTDPEKWQHALRAIYSELSIKALSDDPAIRMNAIFKTLLEALPALGEPLSLSNESEERWIDATARQIEFVRKLRPDDMRQRVWARWQYRFQAYFQQGTTVFETSFEDLWSRIDPKAPEPWAKPVDLRPRLADIALAGWGNVLAGSAGVEGQGWPPWLMLPAASLLGLTILARRMAVKSSEEPPYGDWARAILAVKDKKRASLLIAADTESLYSSWTVSATNPVLYVRASQFAGLVEAISRLGVARPQDIGIDRLFFELSGDPTSLASMVKTAPTRLVSSSPLANAFMSLPCTYLLPEAPAETSDKAAYPYVVAPSSVEDLMSKLTPRPS